MGSKWKIKELIVGENIETKVKISYSRFFPRKRRKERERCCLREDGLREIGFF